MSTLDELHNRLEAISGQLADTRDKIDFKHSLNDGHNLTSGELIARYRFLMDTLKQELAETEVHKRHVSALETDVRCWINSVDLGMS